MQTMIELEFSGKGFPAYFSYPDKGDKFPSIILIHEIIGLTDHIKDVANRLTDQGYAVLAPDLFTGTGIDEKITPALLQDLWITASRAEGQKVLGEIFQMIAKDEFKEQAIGRLQTCFYHLEKNEMLNGKIASVGFCFGGGYSFALACVEPKLTAAVVYYGYPPEDEAMLAKVSSPILAFYGENDTGLVSHLPELEKKMQKAGKHFEAIVYKDAGHAFFNDTAEGMYVENAAKSSWKKLLQFLKRTIS